MDRPYREHVTLGRSGLHIGRLGIGAGYGAPAAAGEMARFRRVGAHVHPKGVLNPAAAGH